jgi:S1-C subfamily serine protease
MRRRAAHRPRRAGCGGAPRLAAALAVLLVAGGAGPVAAQGDSQAVFEGFSDRVVQIRLVESGSASKSGIGSGFVASPAGHVATNYHVVSEAVQSPERYRLELVDGAGAAHPVELLAIDAHHDLAVLRSTRRFEDHFALATEPLRKGTRVFSLGNPFDLGLSIVEGTYNGLLEHSRQQRIHFTGALNPGMSGGPAVLDDGRVVGINVATAGNAVGFLVPAAALAPLLERVAAAGFAPPADFVGELRRQLLDWQQEYVTDLLSRPVQTVRLGAYEAPTRPAPHFDCWGDRESDPDGLYERLSHGCSTYDSIHLSREQTLSTLELEHHELRSTGLGALRFYRLLSQSFEENRSSLAGSKRHLTPFRCRAAFVEHGGLTFKTAFCLRRHRRLEGVYDAVFKAAAVGRPDRGLESVLVLSAVTFENAERLARRHLEAIAWRE